LAAQEEMDVTEFAPMFNFDENAEDKNDFETQLEKILEEEKED
jgi:hypothetical protein